MIRRFSFSDLDRILHIEKQSFPKSPYNWATFADLFYVYPETFLVYVKSIHEQETDQILGYIIYSPDGHIISIAVHPHYRKQGIGKELLQRAMEASHTQKVWAEVRRNNLGAQAFYVHMGFQMVGVVKNYYGNEDALIAQWAPPLRKPH